ncbi:ATP synthase subunit I [Candidatus Dependentiae bacterium]|nr:ATP synthase subunit I [Candidatus Dependentiae bacterium]
MSIFELPYPKFKNVIIFTTLIFSVFLIIFILTFFYKSNNISALLKGLLCGVIASLLNFQLLARKTENVIGAELKEKNNGSSNAKTENKNNGVAELLKSYFLRYMIMAGVLIAASIKKNEINIITTIIGLFSVQISIYFLYIYDFIIKKKNRG